MTGLCVAALNTAVGHKCPPRIGSGPVKKHALESPWPIEANRCLEREPLRAEPISRLAGEWRAIWCAGKGGR